MNKNVKELANHFKSHSETDLAEIKLMILCKILAAYEQHNLIEHNTQAQDKIGEIAEEYVNTYPVKAYDFGVRLVLTPHEPTPKPYSSSNMERYLGLAFLSSDRLWPYVIPHLLDQKKAELLLERLQQIIEFNIGEVPVSRLRSSSEAHAKMVALILIFDLKDLIKTPQFKQLYAYALAEMADPAVIHAINVYKSFPETEEMYERLKSKLSPRP